MDNSQSGSQAKTGSSRGHGDLAPAFLFFSILLLAPVLQGFWSSRTQFVFQAACLFAGGLWLFRAASSVGLPQSLSSKDGLLLLGAAFFSLLGAALSPVRPLVMADWWTFFFGLCVLASAGFLPEGRRRTAELGLRISAWVIMALSLYQAFVLKSPDISASLTNPNALALFALMLIPLAMTWRDYYLLGALVIVLIWTQSLAALLALLAAAGLYAADNARKNDFRRNWPLYAVLAVACALALWQLEPRSVLDRLGWWRAALKMFADSPLLGFGQGAFAWLYPAYHRPEAAGLSSVYVHNYFLEFLAENGALAAACWFWAVFSRLKAAAGLKRYAIAAALVHSLADFGLAVPANFFVFCYILSSPPGENAAPAAVPPAGRAKALAFAAVLAALALVHGIRNFYGDLRLDRLYRSAQAAYSAGDHALAAVTLEKAAAAAPGNPLIPRLQGQALLADSLAKKDRVLLFRAAAALERSLLLNPYNSGAYRDLEYLYGVAGAQGMLADLRQRKRIYIKWER
ncbi:MAG: hypothetical protein A3J79_07300 [Elusimicrobia bacterium RIFOXYB2_FULL_62_6]|nr:MAG: hypothetical protein A3J79_07300 [Elusimicrobia bacterium RIFOXYB2_FULL_62_6]